jgi:sucrose-6-phosphate hydrolase SacC (GH32 family)
MYDPSEPSDFSVDSNLWDYAMSRDTSVALDVGAFYASKSFLSPAYGRLLWGWLPEERPVDAHGSPWGWAGVMSLPRQIIPYRNGSDGAWYVRTPPLPEALAALRLTGSTQSDIAVGAVEYAPLDSVYGQQLEMLVTIDLTNMQDGGDCGIRVLSSLETAAPGNAEYTDVGVLFDYDNGEMTASLYVDLSQSCSDSSAEVNRTVLFAAPLDAGLSPTPGSLEFHVVIDHSVVEAFLADGRRAITRRVYPATPTESTGVQLYSKSGQCSFSSVSSWVLRNAEISSSDTDASSSSNDDASASLEDWELAVVIVSSIVVLMFVIWFVYYVYFRAPDDSKTKLIRSNL